MASKQDSVEVRILPKFVNNTRLVKQLRWQFANACWLSLRFSGFTAFSLQNCWFKRICPETEGSTTLHFQETENSMATKCVYCESTAYGPGCPKSVNGLHQHHEDERRCIYCGSTSYGNGCLQTPTRKHIHGHGGMKCIYCGSIESGMGCKHSPNKAHQK